MSNTCPWCERHRHHVHDQRLAEEDKQWAEYGWAPLVSGTDGGGKRHFLAGQPVHCGTTLELQVITTQAGADGEEITVRVGAGIPVRYEAQPWAESVRYVTPWGSTQEGRSRPPGVGPGGLVTVFLYVTIAGRTARLIYEPSMRFRWPKSRL